MEEGEQVPLQSRLDYAIAGLEDRVRTREMALAHAAMLVRRLRRERPADGASAAQRLQYIARLGTLCPPERWPMLGDWELLLRWRAELGGEGEAIAAARDSYPGFDAIWRALSETGPRGTGG